MLKLLKLKNYYRNKSDDYKKIFKDIQKYISNEVSEIQELIKNDNRLFQRLNLSHLKIIILILKL